MASGKSRCKPDTTLYSQGSIFDNTRRAEILDNRIAYLKLLRTTARQVALTTERFPILYRALRDLFLALPPWLRGRQLIFDHLRNIGRLQTEQSFVQVGANDGITNDPLHQFAKKHRWHGVVVEPVKKYFDLLSENYKGLPVEPVMVAVHATEESMPFYILEESKETPLPPYADGVGSFNPRRAIIVTKELKIPEDTVKTIQVPCRRLEQIVTDSKLNKVDILVIDAEGYDNEILKQARLDDWNTHTLIFEHYHIKPDDLKLTLSNLEKLGFQYQMDKFDVLATRQIR